MKRWKKILLSVVSFIVIFLLGLTVYSHVRYHRSVSSTIAERVLWFTKDTNTPKQANAEIKKLKKAGNKNYKLDSSIKFDVPIKKSNYQGMDTYVLNKKNNNSTVIMYIHGGGYVSQASSQHWSMLNRIAKNTNAQVVVPIYPLAPFATYKRSYTLLTNLYNTIQENKQTKKTVLMGDSAGGGLALGLAESFAKKGIPQPDSMILLSPWADITMQNPQTKKYEKVDPMLDRNTLIADGKSWAGSTNTKNYHVSPINGDLSKLKNVTLFVGTREMFYPDVIKLNNKLTNANVKTKLHIGNGLNHVFPAYPTIEGHRATKQISNIINDL